MRVRNPAGVSEADKIALIDHAPRLFTRPTGEPLIFHADFTLVSEAAPAEPGETLIAYATGLGAVDGPVAAGDLPGEALSKVTAAIGVIVGDRAADVLYAGLAPVSVGLYQVNFTVPPALDDGNFEVAVAAGNERSQGGMRVPVRRRPHGPREFYAAADGTPDGDGSKQRPWDLKTALRPAPAIKPGDILWLRGGLYGDGKTTFESRLAGRPISPSPCDRRRASAPPSTAASPSSRRTPGTGASRSPTPTRTAPPRATRPSAWIPTTAARASSSSTSSSTIAARASASGSARKTPKPTATSSTTTATRTPTAGTATASIPRTAIGTKTIADNIIFSQFGLGIQAYGSSNAYVQGYEMQGNIVFNNGSISDGATYVDNIMIAIGIPMERIRVEDNCTYHPPDSNKGYSRLGWSFSQAANKDVVVRKNMWIGGISAIEMWNWSNITFTDNTTYSEKSLNAILSMADGQDSKTYTWDNNTYYGSGTFRLGEQQPGLRPTGRA